MERKKEIEKLLLDLNNLRWGRKEIEAEYEYAPNYIAQALSRGGNDKLLANLKKLHARVVREAEAAQKPGDKMNPVKAFMLAMADDYAIRMADLTNGDPKKIKKEIIAKANLILGGLDQWPFED